MRRVSMAIMGACGAAMIGLSACSAADGDAEGLTRAEERELDEAAAALDAAQAEYEAAIQSAEPVPEEAAPDTEE
ncbi:MAG: hypothetical protein ACTS1Z_03240 [Parasphingopyxis sp.]|uniref:hypothetical protein n=1 Tax=Parasphingopyxis sp. TaxID=1920299 RepID=UPI003FA165C1